MSLRLAVVRDFRAEGWPSMDLCADQLLAHCPPGVIMEDVAPPFRRVVSRIPLSQRFGFNADRLLNRHLFLPHSVRRTAGRADFLHVVDHSYAHIVRSVPPGRSGVYCHDLDAFRSILEPDRDRRPWWFRRLALRTLNGFRLAAVVFHNSLAIGKELIDWGIVPPDRLVHAPLGVADEFFPPLPPGEGPGVRAEPAEPVQLPVAIDGPFLLHVGSNIPRKRLDVLLDVFAAVRSRLPDVRLIQVGGPWPPHLAERIIVMKIDNAVTQLSGLTRLQLAELYRRTAAVLVTSEAEGFGLPVIEALACGAVVVASDIPVLREVGGAVVEYCPVADVTAWAETIVRILATGSSTARKSERFAHAARFSWKEHARIIGETYLRLAAGKPQKCVFSS